MAGTRNNIWASYTGVWSILSVYWAAYGGWVELLKSVYFHVSLLLLLVALPYLSGEQDDKWYSLVISVIPNMLGFTLGGYAILISFGDDRFRELFSGKRKDDEPSPYMMINAAFIHFIIVQLLSLVLACLGWLYSVESLWLAIPGFWCFLYALLTSIAAALAILRLSSVFDEYISMNKSGKQQKRRPTVSAQAKRIKRNSGSFNTTKRDSR